MNVKKSVTVVHLVWIPFGIETFKNFIDSYKKNTREIAHDLVLLFNNNNMDYEINLFIDYADQHQISYTFYKTSNLQDLDSYRWVASKLSCDYILFFNSYSVIKVENWLELYVTILNQNYKLISASGSYQSHYSSVFLINKWYWEFDKNFIYNFRKYKLFLKAFFYWHFLFNKFPSPHIRTNAFMVNRDVFLKIKYNQPLQNKMDAYKLESGKNSITNQFLKMGYGVCIIDKYGKAYEIGEWDKSKTFWQGKQENLLVIDNQTEAYEKATPSEKLLMTKQAWGI
jgi:hypothetical protein